jgi:hypothetical protein
VVAATTGEGAALASAPSVCVGLAIHSVAGKTVDGASLDCVRLVGVGSASHCGDCNDR